MASLPGWFCELVCRKQVSFFVLQVQLWLVGFSRVSKVMVEIRVSLVLATGWG